MQIIFSLIGLAGSQLNICQCTTVCCGIQQSGADSFRTIAPDKTTINGTAVITVNLIDRQCCTPYIRISPL